MRHELTGCRSQPLSSYLQGLGAWRALARTADPTATAYWRDGVLNLETDLDRDQLIDVFVEQFHPAGIVAPWNEGSGFAGNGKSKAAEDAVATVRVSVDPRLAELQAAVRAADEIVAHGRTRGWGGAKDEMWDKRRKADVLRLCRNVLPDDALAAMDAAVVLSSDGDPTYARLLGTGLNLGRLDLSANYLQRVVSIVPAGPANSQSADWVRAMLFADLDVQFERRSAGQYDPGGASSELSNPWAFVMLLEGALFFASAAVRQLGAARSGAAVPFAVRGSPVGFGTSSIGENILGELWAPEWVGSASVAEIEQLIGEGRADWRGSPARTGLDFVRAISSLGVDRGISRFTRYVFAERLGQSPLAVPVGRVDVRARGSMGLFGRLDPWLADVRRATRTGTLDAGLRAVDAVIYSLATATDTTPLDLLSAVGRLHRLVERSSTAREKARPLTLGRAADWIADLDPTSAEVRLAIALASGQDEATTDSSLRRLMSAVSRPEGRLAWTNRSPLVPAGADVVAALAGAHRRRSAAGEIDDPAGTDEIVPVRGTFTAFRHSCPAASLADVASLVSRDIDTDRLADLLHGLMLLDWSSTPSLPPSEHRDLDRPIPPGLALLIPFFHPRPLRFDTDGPGPAVVLRPGAGWIGSLVADRPGPVLTDASRRLRISGAAGVIDVGALSSPRLDGPAMAAALLVPLRSADVRRALRAVTDVRSAPSPKETADA